MVLTLARALRIPALVVVALVVLFAVQDGASAAAQTSTASGDWTSTATWVSGSVPASGDTVTIASGHTVTVSTTVSIVGITVDAGGTLVVTGSLSVGPSNLAVEGTVTNNGTLSVTGTLTGAGSLTQGTSATLNIGNALAPTITTLDATTNLPNTVNYNGAGQAIKVNTYSNLTLSGSGTKTGTPTSMSGALTLAGTAEYATPTGMVVGGDLNVQGGALTIPDGVTITGNTTVSGGTLTITNIAGTKTFSGDITVNGGTWDNDDVVEPVAVGGNITFISGTFTSGTGLYTLNGANKTITGPISIAAVTLVAPGSLSISGTVSIGALTATATTVTNNGTLTISESLGVAAALAGTGTLVNGTNATLNLETTVVPAITNLNLTTNTPNLVNYTRAGAQVIKGASTYHHLTLSGSGAKTGTTGITVNGTFTLAASATFTPGAFAYTMLGNFVNNSDAVTPVTAVATSTLNFDTPSPAVATSIGGTSNSTLALTVLNFNNTSGVSTSKTITSTTVNVGGSATFTNNGTFTSTALTVNGGGTLTNNATMTSAVVNVNSGATFTNASAGTHTASGVFTVASSGIYTNNGTTTTTGTLVGAGSFVNGTNSTLNLNNAAAPTITTLNLTTNTPNTVTYALGGVQSIRSGSYSNLTLATSGIKTAAGELTVSGTFTLTGTAAFTAGAFTHTFTGSWVHDTAVATPLVATGSTIVFATPSPAAARSISGSAGTTLAFEAITVSNTSGLTLSKSISATGLVTVSGSLTVAAAATVTISGTGALTVANGATLSNAGTVSITGTGALTVGGGSGATFTNTGTVNAAGLLDGSGTFLNNANATLNITSAAAPAITTLNLTDSTPNTVNYSLAGAQTVRAGTYHHLTLSTSGTKTANGSITVNGTFTVSGTASFATTATTHHIKGNWVHAVGATVVAAGGSVVSFEGASATISGAGTVALAGVAVTNGAGITSLISLSASGTFTVHTGGTLTLDSGVVVSGAGTFVLASGGTLAIRSPLGITSSGASGNVQTTTRTFDTGANYTYNSTSGAQVTGNGLPATVRNLTLSNTSGVTLTSSVAVTGALTFTTGTVTPVISGTTTNGETLTTTNGTWLNAPTFTYQWQRCKPGCTNIAGATATTYVLTADDVDATIRVNVTGTYTNAFTVSSAQTATIAPIGGVQPTPTPTPAPSGGGGGAAPPAPTPTPTPPALVVEEPGFGDVTFVTDGSAVQELSSDAPAAISATSGGSALVVSVPAGALGAATEIVMGFVADLAELVETALPPDDAALVVGFAVQARTSDATPITDSFAAPVTISLTVAKSDLPAGSTAATLALAFWNGNEWVVTPATILVNANGSVTVTASVTHFTMFGLFRQPTMAWTATFPRAGVLLAIWQGLTGTEPLSAAGFAPSIARVTAVWRMDVVTQRFESWVRGAPAFVNRILTLRSGEPLILRIGDTPPRTTPAPTPAATPTPTPSGGTPTAGVQYTVKSTDTLAAIGAQFGVPWLTIAAANGIAGPDYFIHTGQVLTIPGVTPPPANAIVLPTPSSSTPTTPAAPSTNRTHVVLSTDTLSGIGTFYGVPWLTIAAANDIPGPNYFIRTGQVLTIPSGASAPSGPSTPTAPAATPTAPSTSGAARMHVVLSTDTLSGIGALYGVPWLTIAAANGIEGPNYFISTGQVLTIPSISSPAASPAGTQTVVVGEGETLSQIGARVGVPWLEIAEANGIAGPLYVVRSGQVVVIPGR